MKYKIQIAGWFSAGIMSLLVGYFQETVEGLPTMIYWGVIALWISIVLWYLTNRTDIVEKMMERAKKKSAK